MKHQLLLSYALTLTALAVSSKDADMIKPSDYTRRMVGGKSEKDTNSKPKSPSPKPSSAAKATPNSKGGKIGEGNSYTKSGKGSKAGDYDYYYMAPFTCPGKCIDADGENFDNEGVLQDAVMPCSMHSMHGRTQQWLLHMSSDIVQVESSVDLGKCISVNTDTKTNIKDACSGGTLKLLSCDNPASLWYFSGAQLLSSFCWAHASVSAAMSVTPSCEELIAAHNGTDVSTTNSAASAQATFMLMTIEDMSIIYSSDVIDHSTYSPTLSPIVGGP
ncbi:hypothetical protein ACHAW5_004658 [Stephanodiscus triporus]|uniref:Ricin B lectin domain-containing protein n=1 Tax=Stephanodiscus triporus TaxID=2934178 RepID=A0ABD3MRN0_9STRA